MKITITRTSAYVDDALRETGELLSPLRLSLLLALNGPSKKQKGNGEEQSDAETAPSQATESFHAAQGYSIGTVEGRALAIAKRLERASVSQVVIGMPSARDGRRTADGDTARRPAAAARRGNLVYCSVCLAVTSRGPSLIVGRPGVVNTGRPAGV